MLADRWRLHWDVESVGTRPPFFLFDKFDYRFLLGSANDAIGARRLWSWSPLHVEEPLLATTGRYTWLTVSMYMHGRLHSADKEYRRFGAQVVCIRILAGERLIDDMKRYIVTKWSLISLRKDTRGRKLVG